MHLCYPQIWPNFCLLQTQSGATDTTSVTIGQPGSGLETPTA